MHHYLTQLLSDIAAAKRTEAPPLPAEPASPFADAERYLHEAPTLALAQHCGLKAADFPPAERLTEAQQEAVAEALKEAYFTYGVSLALPEELPTALRYRFYIEALNEKCWVSDGGMTTIEYCEDGPESCPFGWRHCACLDDWLDKVEAIRNKPPADWTEEDYLEDCWLTAIQENDECRMALEQGNSPNKRYVLQLLADIEEARVRFCRAGGFIRLEEPEEDAPGAEYRPFLEWMDMPDAVFPPLERLAEPEAEALSYALLLLYGKDSLAVSLMAVSAPARYRQLVEHFTMPIRRVGEMQFLAPRGGFDFSRFPDLLEGL
ncbi:MAG: hypothetical protein KDC75_15630 [Phaeodactylibacter sp.]|nr:hypothetical protein [Phaeodactylibacter sp.]